jgi:hypothetical protein
MSLKAPVAVRPAPPPRVRRVACMAQRRDMDALDFDEPPPAAPKKTPRHIRRLQRACATTTIDGREDEDHRLANRLRARADQLDREAKRAPHVDDFFLFLDL